MAVTAFSYVIASLLLFVAAFIFARGDTERMQAALAAETLAV
jgi:hypothetical protein